MSAVCPIDEGELFYDGTCPICLLRVAQDYADAYRNWHVHKDYSAESMKRFRTTRDALLAAFDE
jgi:hypothetical protein